MNRIFYQKDSSDFSLEHGINYIARQYKSGFKSYKKEKSKEEDIKKVYTHNTCYKKIKKNNYYNGCE